MENRKTAEEVYKELVPQPFYSYIIKAMHTFAEQEAEVISCEFIDWSWDEGYNKIAGHWYDKHGVWLKITTTQLYQIFKAKRDGE